MTTTVIPRIGLTTPQWNTYKSTLFYKESGSTGYKSIGGAGGRYIGGYQISDSALVGAGYLRPGSATGVPGYAWKNDRNWQKPDGSPITPGIRNYQDFLNNPQAQDDALLKFTQRNATALTNFGILNDNLTPAQRAGNLAAAHLLGATGLRREGLDGRDGFGTKARTYYNDIAMAIGRTDRRLQAIQDQAAASIISIQDQERAREAARQTIIANSPGASSSLVTAHEEYFKPKFFASREYQYTTNQQPVFLLGPNPTPDKIPKMFVNGREVATTIDSNTGELKPTAPLGFGEKLITWQYPGSSQQTPQVPYIMIPTGAERQQLLESVGDPAFRDFEIKFAPPGSTTLDTYELFMPTWVPPDLGVRGTDYLEVVLVNGNEVGHRYEPWLPNIPGPRPEIIVITTPLPIGPHTIVVQAVTKDGKFLATSRTPRDILVAENPEDVIERVNKLNPTDILLQASTQTSTAFPTQDAVPPESVLNIPENAVPGRYTPGLGGELLRPNNQGPYRVEAVVPAPVAAPVPVRVASSNSSDAGQVTPLVPNPLHDFQSYTYLFTFSSLSSEAVNFPTTSYLKGNLGRIIFSSAGRYSENRTPTAYSNPENPSGKYDFFVDNVVMDHLVTPAVEIGSTNLLNIKFEVTEPYSVGQFLQSCQIAANINGHYSYIDSPFLLTLEFKGYVDNNVKTIENTIRYIPVKIRSITLGISEGGSKYQVDVIAWTDQAFDDEYNILKQDSVISGKTVVETLQTGDRSLQAVVNKRLKEIAQTLKVKAYIPNEIAIVFPNLSEPPPSSQSSNQGATASSTSAGDPITKIGSRNSVTGLITQAASSVNKIGNSVYKFTPTDGGDLPKQPDIPEIIKEFTNRKYSRNSFNNDYSQREFTFRKSTSIVNAITEALLLSEYCDNIRKNVTDSLGFVDWFKIESQVYELKPNEFNNSAGVFPKLLVYRIVPHKVHISKFQSPDVTAKGYQQMANQVSKEYNYIYTGKNDDVLDFKLNLNVNFASNYLADGLGAYSSAPLLAATGKSSAGVNQNSTAFVYDPQQAAPGQGKGDSGIGTGKHRTLASSYKPSDGAGLAAGYLSKVATVFQDRILNGDAELVSATLSILGDPYYISYSGTGNYSVSDYGSSKNVTSLGSFDYQKGEVDILFNFLTPVDLSSSGRLIFEKDIETSLAVPFSGLYFIRSVTSTFSKGKFTQDLAIVRRPNQNTTGNLTNTYSQDRSDRSIAKDGGAVVSSNQSVKASYRAGTGTDSDLIATYNPLSDFG